MRQRQTVTRPTGLRRPKMTSSEGLSDDLLSGLGLFLDDGQDLLELSQLVMFATSGIAWVGWGEVGGSGE